jgi:hypothetical protein
VAELPPVPVNEERLWLRVIALTFGDGWCYQRESERDH